MEKVVKIKKELHEQVCFDCWSISLRSFFFFLIGCNIAQNHNSVVTACSAMTIKALLLYSANVLVAIQSQATEEEKRRI